MRLDRSSSEWTRHAPPVPHAGHVDLLQERAVITSWTLTDTFEGSTFFGDFTFYTDPDPTEGQVTFLSSDEAWNQGLVNNQQGSDDNTRAWLGVDSWTDLPPSTPRTSIRITSNKTYSGGLFILNLTHVPTGCSVWPAFWFCGDDPDGGWPAGGEVDVFEVVNDGEGNGMTLHTEDGCYLTSPGAFSGTPLDTDCYSSQTDNDGCGISAPSGTAGDGWNDAGGGVYAMQWDNTGIQIWSFPRSTIPPDALTDSPDPLGWRIPDAAWSSSGCDIGSYFYEMNIIFDITLCGTWAGDPSTWSSSGCAGSCAETVMTGSNYQQAYFLIDSLRVFQPLDGPAYVFNSSTTSTAQALGDQVGGLGNESSIVAASGGMERLGGGRGEARGWVQMGLWAVGVMILSRGR